MEVEALIETMGASRKVKQPRKWPPGTAATALEMRRGRPCQMRSPDAPHPDPSSRPHPNQAGDPRISRSPD